VAAASGLALLAARPWIVAAAPADRTSSLFVLYALAGGAAAWAVRGSGTGTAARVVPVSLAGVGAVLAAHALVPRGPSGSSGPAIVAVNLVAAVAEEALFRGALYTVLERYGAVLACIVSASTFAFLHVPAYGWAALPVDLGAGVLFSWQRWACGRWEAPAAAHVVANLLVVIR
jgi:membrane protease YdiL (CAAX protease family)